MGFEFVKIGVIGQKSLEMFVRRERVEVGKHGVAL